MIQLLKIASIALLTILCSLSGLSAQDWSIGINHKTILTKSSSFSQHGFAVFNDQVFTPIGIEFTKELNSKIALKLNASTTQRSIEFSFDNFFEFNSPIEREDFDPTVENDIYFFSTALHYEIASYNGFRIRPLMGFSLLLENEEELSQSALFRSKVFEDESAIAEFSQRLINEINPFFDIGIEVVIPVFSRVNLGISYLHSRPIFGAYYTQNYDFAQLIGNFNTTGPGLQPLPQRYVVNERFTDKLVLDTFSFSLSYRFR